MTRHTLFPVTDQSPAVPQIVPVHDTTVLTQGGSLAQIVLHGQCYWLRITRAGKLILTK